MRGGLEKDWKLFLPVLGRFSSKLVEKTLIRSRLPVFVSDLSQYRQQFVIQILQPLCVEIFKPTSF